MCMLPPGSRGGTGCHQLDHLAKYISIHVDHYPVRPAGPGADLGSGSLRAEMADTSPTQAFPRRDADGRVLRLPEFLVAVLGYTLVNAVGLALIDWLIGLLRVTGFGRSPGWLMLILPGLLYFEDLRAWRGYGIRFLVAIVAAAVGIGLGLIVAGLASSLPPIVSGGVGAVVAVLVYAPIWFLGIRWLTGEQPT